MNRTFDGLTIDEIIEIQENINKQGKYYRLFTEFNGGHRIIEERTRGVYYCERILIDLNSNCFVTNMGDFFFRYYRKTWSDKREDLEKVIENDIR